MFLGYQKTKMLWENDAIRGMGQFIPKNTYQSFNIQEHKSLRLGKWVEKFVLFQLQQMPNCQIITDSLQIKDEQNTLGELDVLLIHQNVPIHLEIVYKFYLFDIKSKEKDALSNWIGPNKKDNLNYKLEKLKHKQLPLLYNTKTKQILENYKFDINSVKQHVLFKAQLFLPYGRHKNQVIEPLNKSCISGFYLDFQRFDLLQNTLIYIPQKLEWLIEPNVNVQWLEFEKAKELINKSILTDCSPMIWVKNKLGEINKCFITWWSPN
jgi:hypothetical protein